MIRPVAIFAATLADAHAFAREEGLKTREWLFVRDVGSTWGRAFSAVAVLPTFPMSRYYSDLRDLADRLEAEAGPYVPSTTTLRG